jgi:hypothetical protein
MDRKKGAAELKEGGIKGRGSRRRMKCGVSRRFSYDAATCDSGDLRLGGDAELSAVAPKIIRALKPKPEFQNIPTQVHV